MTAFIFGLIVGAVGAAVAAFLVYRNNKKKVAAAIAILQGPGTTDEKIKKIKELFGL
jgi:hypothetical protein